MLVGVNGIKITVILFSVAISAHSKVTSCKRISSESFFKTKELERKVRKNKTTSDYGSLQTQ